MNRRQEVTISFYWIWSEFEIFVKWLKRVLCCDLFSHCKQVLWIWFCISVWIFGKSFVFYTSIFLIVKLCVSVGSCARWAWNPFEVKVMGIPWSWSHRWLRVTWCEFWEPHSGSLQKLHMLSITEPPLQPLEGLLTCVFSPQMWIMTIKAKI